MTRDAVDEQVRRQLHGHLTYFFPGGGSAMGWTKKDGRVKDERYRKTTTLPSQSIHAWQTKV